MQSSQPGECSAFTLTERLGLFFTQAALLLIAYGLYSAFGTLQRCHSVRPPAELIGMEV